MCDNILFVHGIFGCDATSPVHGLGKEIALKKIKIVLFYQHIIC